MTSASDKRNRKSENLELGRATKRIKDDHLRTLFLWHLELRQQKSVSYLPVDDLRLVFNLSIEEFRFLVRKTNNRCFVVKHNKSCIGSTIVVIYNEIKVENVLAKHKDVLVGLQFPVTTKEFLHLIAKNWISEPKEVLKVIEELYGEWPPNYFDQEVTLCSSDTRFRLGSVTPY